MVRVAAASRKKKPLFRLLSLIAVSWVLIAIFAFDIFKHIDRRHGKPPIARRTAREARGVCVSSRTVQAEEPSGDDEDQEQAASAQTTDLVGDATKAYTAAKSRESIPALGRIWPQPDDCKKWPSISWKRHSRRLTPCRRCGYKNWKLAATPKRPRRPSRS
ncbi:unnamed protein product [Symbiodinium sp. CCMP2592]|nr:unnamed protein product [Symbiodinium sp. CCMP2592]